MHLIATLLKQKHPRRERSIRPLLVGSSLVNVRLQKAPVAGQVGARVGRTSCTALAKSVAHVLRLSWWTVLPIVRAPVSPYRLQRELATLARSVARPMTGQGFVAEEQNAAVASVHSIGAELVNPLVAPRPRDRLSGLPVV